MIIEKPLIDNHLAFLLDQSKQPSAICDYEGNIIYINEHFKNEYGVQKKLFTSNLMDKITDCDGQSFLIKAKLNKKQECCVITDADCMPITGTEQIIISFRTNKCTEKMQSFYTDIFHKTNSFIIAADHSGKIIAANDQAYSFVKLTAKQIVGKSVDVLISMFTDEREVVNSYLKKVMKNGFAEAVRKFTYGKDDIRQYYFITFYNQHTNQFIIRIYDITTTAKIEDSRAYSAALSSIGKMAATIVHEVRNPMTSLKGFIQLLRIAPQEDMMKYLTVIEDEIERMDSLLTEMLTLSKPAIAKKTTFSLEVLVQDMIHFIQPQALLEGITIVLRNTVMHDSLIVGDANKIKQAILNLVKNAIESMPGKGNITIDIYTGGKDKIALSITDTGHGMVEDQLTKMFTPFYSCKSGGTGLGMPFVKETIEHHGGSIDVRSEKGIGTTVTLTFPFEQPAENDKDFVSEKVVS